MPDKYRNRWRPEEDDLIRAMWDQHPLREIAARLGRHKSSVSRRASRTLGLPRQMERWTPAEDEILRRHFATSPTACVARRLGRSAACCSQRADRLGIRGTARGGAAARG